MTEESTPNNPKSIFARLSSLPPLHLVFLAGLLFYVTHVLFSTFRTGRLLSFADDSDEHAARDAAFIRRILADSDSHMVSPCSLSDVIGQDEAKGALTRNVVWPLLNLRLFSGLREAAPAVLLYGPPGTGKTMLVRALAGLVRRRAGGKRPVAFFNVTASTFAAKYHGDGERLVRCLFNAARDAKRAIIFIDEIDALMGSRQTDMDDAMRRLKTELLVSLDGLVSGGHGNDSGKVILIAATNMPHLLDAAFLRRCGRRVHVRMPNSSARMHQLQALFRGEKCHLSASEMQSFVEDDLKGYSASDVKGVAREAAMAALEELVERPGREMDIRDVHVVDLPPITLHHLRLGRARVKPSLCPGLLQNIEAWERSMHH